MSEVVNEQPTAGQTDRIPTWVPILLFGAAVQVATVIAWVSNAAAPGASFMLTWIVFLLPWGSLLGGPRVWPTGWPGLRNHVRLNGPRLVPWLLAAGLSGSLLGTWIGLPLALIAVWWLGGRGRRSGLILGTWLVALPVFGIPAAFLFALGTDPDAEDGITGGVLLLLSVMAVVYAVMLTISYAVADRAGRWEERGRRRWWLPALPLLLTAGFIALIALTQSSMSPDGEIFTNTHTPPV